MQSVSVSKKLLYDVALDIVKESTAVIAMDVQCKLLGEVEAEDTHDGLCIDSVSAGNDVYVIVALCYDVYEVLYVIDCVDADLCCCHNYLLPFLFVQVFCIISYPAIVVNGNFVAL